MSDGLSAAEVAGALERMRAELKRDLPSIVRIYLTPVPGADP